MVTFRNLGREFLLAAGGDQKRLKILAAIASRRMLALAKGHEVLEDVPDLVGTVPLCFTPA